MSCEKHRRSWLFASVAAVFFIAGWVILGVSVIPPYQRAKQIDRIACIGSLFAEAPITCLSLKDCQTVSTTQCDVVFPSCSDYNTTSSLGNYRCCQGAQSCQLNVQTCTEYTVQVKFTVRGATRIVKRLLTFAATQKVPVQAPGSYECFWDNEHYALLDEWKMPESAPFCLGVSIVVFVISFCMVGAACRARFSRQRKESELGESLNPMQ